MAHCENCGTRLSGNICPNCHEELYIFETQSDYLPPLSDEFAEQVKEQRAEVRGRALGKQEYPRMGGLNR